MTNSQTKERFGLAALLDIPVGIMSALSNEVGSFCRRTVCEIRPTPLAATASSERLIRLAV